MDAGKHGAAEYRERAQQLLWIADLVPRDDARKILFQIAAEYQDRARQLEQLINAKEATKAAPDPIENTDKTAPGEAIP